MKYVDQGEDMIHRHGCCRFYSTHQTAKQASSFVFSEATAARRATCRGIRSCMEERTRGSHASYEPSVMCWNSWVSVLILLRYQLPVKYQSAHITIHEMWISSLRSIRWTSTIMLATICCPTKGVLGWWVICVHWTGSCNILARVLNPAMSLLHHTSLLLLQPSPSTHLEETSLPFATARIPPCVECLYAAAISFSFCLFFLCIFLHRFHVYVMNQVNLWWFSHRWTARFESLIFGTAAAVEKVRSNDERKARPAW